MSFWNKLRLWLLEPNKYWLLKNGLQANGGTLVITIDQQWPEKTVTQVRITNVDRYSVVRSSWADDGPYGMEHNTTVSMLLTTGEVVTESAEWLTVKVEKS